MLYITNAISLNMLPEGVEEFQFNGSKVSVERAREIVDQLGTRAGYANSLIGAIGHEDTATAAAIALALSKEEIFRRTTVQVKPKDTLLVAQYRGDRLPEGFTTLPDGARIEFWVVDVEDPTI